MAWPIPDIPEQKTLSVPKYWLWITVLIFMLITGAISSIWIWQVTSYAKVFFYGVMPVFFIWLCFFGMMLNRYEQSLIASRAWYLETERTKDEWTRWSRQQIAVVGNVLFSPEEDGMAALLGEIDKVPIFPNKARPLFNSPCDFSNLMKEIDLKLEQQCPGYRHFLYYVYVFQFPDRFDESHNESIFQQWNLIPTLINSTESIESFYDNKITDELVLILNIQNWPAGHTGQSSEFISAQLISSPIFVRQHSLPVIAGITRMMPLEAGELTNELDMFVKYTQFDELCLEYVWLSGALENTAAVIMQYATQHQWPLPEKRPLYYIDLSFGPPGEMALPLFLAMLTETANKTGKEQLLVSQTSQQTGTLCLITRELYHD